MSQPAPKTPTEFHALLLEQVRHEFTASQQYIAVAVYFDSHDLPQLAHRFYSQAAEQITALARTARDSGDYLGERFMQWFLEEQVEEVASMHTLLTIVDRAGDNLFDIEDFIAREMNGSTPVRPGAPKRAGGSA
jgi:ferritin